MEVQDKVFAKVAENMGVDKDSLTLETTFEQLGADSLDMVEFSMDVEGEYGIVVEQADMAGIKTVGDAVRFVEKKIAKK